MAFMALGLLELVHSFNIKTEESIFKSGVFENKYLVGAFILGLLLQLIVVMIPPVAEIFGVVPLTQTQWIYTIVISFAPIVIMEIQKKINEERLENVIYEYEKSWEKVGCFAFYLFEKRKTDKMKGKGSFLKENTSKIYIIMLKMRKKT